MISFLARYVPGNGAAQRGPNHGRSQARAANQGTEVMAGPIGTWRSTSESGPSPMICTFAVRLDARSYHAAILLCVAACSRPESRAATPTLGEGGAANGGGPTDLRSEPAPDAGPNDAGPSDGGAACIHPMYQPAACMQPDGELDGEAAVAWLADHDAKVPESYLGYNAHCRALAFGPEADAVLACTLDTFAPGPLFANGPMVYHRDLRLLTVRNGKAFELVRLPLAFTEALQWDNTLFAARYALDAAAGTVDLVISPEECASVRKSVGEYHQAWVTQIVGQVPASQIEARKAQARLDDARLVATCKAAGHYVPTRGGHLVRAK